VIQACSLLQARSQRHNLKPFEEWFLFRGEWQLLLENMTPWLVFL